MNDVTEIVKKNLTSNEVEKMMSLADRLRAEGIEQGIERGMEQGVKKGKGMALRTVVTNLYVQGVTIERIAAITNLSVDEVESLKSHS